jgi:phage gpG-like protein
MGLRLDIKGVKELDAQLEDLQVKIGDYEPLWDALSDVMAEHEAEWFATEGEGTWPPLSPATLADKARGGYPPDPLIRTGRLLESLTDPESAAEVSQGRTTLGTFTKKTFSWGSDEPTAEYHQEGREPGPGYPGMPARPVIVLTPALRTRIDDAAEEFVRDRVREAGLGESQAR